MQYDNNLGACLVTGCYAEASITLQCWICDTSEYFCEDHGNDQKVGGRFYCVECYEQKSCQ